MTEILSNEAISMNDFSHESTFNTLRRKGYLVYYEEDELLKIGNRYMKIVANQAALQKRKSSMGLLG